MKILITGGAGYIGTHILLKLLEKNYEIVVFDNYSNSTPIALQRVKEISNKNFTTVEGDICNSQLVEQIFSDFKPNSIIHLAGLKAVGDSNEVPLTYYSNNVCGTIILLKAMQKYGCKNIIFSSSATVYGEPKYLPYDENHPLNPTNPYGRTKHFIEQIIRDWNSSWADSSCVALRYFNPVGANASTLIGEDPKGTPSNLMPYLTQVAIRRLQYLYIFGDNFDTRDGTGERDYIHVEDLASAHISALIYATSNTGFEAVNIGTGYGVTVNEMLNTFMKISGRKIPFKIVSNRDGDVARSFASTEKAKDLLNWSAKYNLEDMCKSAWNWQKKNPSGYKN